MRKRLKKHYYNVTPEEANAMSTPDTTGRVVMIVVVGIGVMVWIGIGIVASVFLFKHFQ